MKVLIDADVLRYRCGYATEDEPVQNALYNTKNQIKSILSATNADDYALYLTGKGNFRYDIATIKPYKGNRSQEKPKHYDAITEYLIHTWKAEVINGMEADDALSIEQCRAWSFIPPIDTCIATIDKDLSIVPGYHYNFVTDEFWFNDEYGGLELDRTGKKPKLVGTGLMWFYAQMLTGDRVDNIQGCPRVGDVAAYNTLKDCATEHELFCEVGKKYAEKYDDPESALLENGRLLWMLQEENVMWEFPL